MQTKNKQANRIFSVFVLLIALDLTGFFLYNWWNQYPLLHTFKVASSLLQMPLFYFYVLSICYYNFRLRWVHLWHALLFGTFFLALIPRFYQLDQSGQVAFLNDPNTTESLVFNVLAELQYYGYILLTILTLRKFKNVYLENYSVEFYTFYRWLWQVIVVFLAAHVFAFSKNIIEFGTNSQFILLANLIVSLIATGISCWFVLSALYQPTLFRGIDARLEVVNEKTPLQNTQNTNSAELSDGQQQQLDKLEKLMTEEELYLDPSLNIQQLADKLELPAKELSQLINVHLGQNFFNLINAYRIGKAQEILKDPDKRQVTVLEILYEVGFNSKSSFNTAFKKHSGVTPTQYRKTQLG